MQGELAIPRFLEGGRKAAFLNLLAIAIGEVAAQVLAAASVKAVVTGTSDGLLAAASLLLSGSLAATLGWLRNLRGERLGLSYVNELRRMLARQAIAVSSGGGPGRFGTLAIRMHGDLNAIRDWANIGVCGGVAGLIGLVGAFSSAWLAARAPGVVACAIAATLSAAVVAMGIPGMSVRIAGHRRTRGRLSAKVGDLLLGAGAAAAYSAQNRAIRPVRKAGEAVLESAYRESRLRGALLIPVMLTVPLGAAFVVLLEASGPSIVEEAGGWATLLFALGLTALALRLLADAAFQFVEHRIAMHRIDELIDRANEMPSESHAGHRRLPPGPGMELKVGDITLVGAGENATRSRDRHVEYLELVGNGDGAVSVDGLSAAEVYPLDWARRVAMVGPSRPLRRGRLSQVIAAKRNAEEAVAREALSVAGLGDLDTTSDPLIDPWSTHLSEWTIARLRLVRALCHRPRVVIVDDPWLSTDGNLTKRLTRHCRQRGISLLTIA